jgi:hypothetical protein
VVLSEGGRIWFAGLLWGEGAGGRGLESLTIIGQRVSFYCFELILFGQELVSCL